MCSDYLLCIICGAVSFHSCLNTVAHDPYGGGSKFPEERDYYRNEGTEREGLKKAREKRQEFDWLNRYFYVGENIAYEPKGDGDHRIFFTKESKYGHLEPGDDPRLPEIPILDMHNQLVDGNRPSMRQIRGRPSIYFDFNDESAYPLLISFHSTCYKDLLCKAITARIKSRSISSRQDMLSHENNEAAKGYTIDQTALYEALKAQLRGDLHSMTYANEEKEEFGLSIDDRRLCDCELWPLCSLGPFITNPVEIPQLQQLYLNLPTRPKLDDTDPRGTKSVFSSLPMEINLLIVQYLPPESVESLSTASPVIATIVREISYWKKQFQETQPWIFDIPDEAFDREDVHWYQIYKELAERSEESHPNAVLGLVNRRRIWQVCQMIVDEYFQYVDGTNTRIERGECR